LTEQIHAYVDQLAKALELAGVAIIVGGIVFATFVFIRDGARAGDWQSAYPGYRSNIGRGILLGLELLVGADIIATITAPLTVTSVGLLAGRGLLAMATRRKRCGAWQAGSTLVVAMVRR